MLKANIINILTTLAALALSFLILTRAAPPDLAEVGPAAVAAASQHTNAIIISSYPADAIIIESIPAP
ncbi:MAG: hypothetical protein JSU81_10730 [Candidatus Coatesbacteria bacterium]|nr:MAG: hypothetical protein JSU81_10730 [Candidatus Coatesbacteria bacterium]